MAILKTLFLTTLLVASVYSQCDTIQDRNDAVRYIHDSASPSVTGQARTSTSTFTILDFAFAAASPASPCWIDDVEINAYYFSSSVKTGLSEGLYNKAGFTFEVDFLDSYIADSCTSVDFNDTVKYTCPLQFDAHYKDDVIMEWSFNLSLVLANGVTLVGMSIATDQADIDGNTVELPLEGNFAGSLDGTGSNVGPYIVGDFVYPMVSPPDDIAGDLDGEFASILFVDTDGSEYEMLDLSPTTLQLANGSMIAEIPLLFVTESLTAEIRLTVNWSLSARRVLEVASTNSYSFTIKFQDPSADSSDDETSDDDSSSSSDNNMIIYAIAGATVVILAGIFVAARVMANKKKDVQEHKPEAVPATEGVEFNKV